jgi:hypothetical protein
LARQTKEEFVDGLGDSGSQLIKPRRGGLFIEPHDPTIVSFCFSAARWGDAFPDQSEATPLSEASRLFIAAPLKNKKKDPRMYPGL